MSRFNNLSRLAAVALVTVLVAPWIPKLAGAPQTTFKVKLWPGDPPFACPGAVLAHALALARALILTSGS